LIGHSPGAGRIQPDVVALDPILDRSSEPNNDAVATIAADNVTRVVTCNRRTRATDDVIVRCADFQENACFVRQRVAVYIHTNPVAAHHVVMSSGGEVETARIQIGVGDAITGDNIAPDGIVVCAVPDLDPVDFPWTCRPALRIHTVFFRNNTQLDRVQFERDVLTLLDQQFQKKAFFQNCQASPQTRAPL